MTRFYFQIKEFNVFDVVWAETKIDAQHQVINSAYAPFYGHIEWLNAEPNPTTLQIND